MYVNLCYVDRPTHILNNEASVAFIINYNWCDFTELNLARCLLVVSRDKNGKEQRILTKYLYFLARIFRKTPLLQR